MKNRRFLLTITVLSIILLVVGNLAYQNFKSSLVINDKKSKLTLLKTVQDAAQKIPTLKDVIAKNLAKQNTVADAQVNNPNVLTAERIYTENEINEMSEIQFSGLIKDTELKLPKLSDIKKIPPGALHHTPVLIIQAGRDLGVIKEILKIHKEFEKVAIPFYKNCAKNLQGTTPVRALCLTNLIEIKKNNNENLNLKDYPETLVELSRMVTGI